jgi:hypothetical protein
LAGKFLTLKKRGLAFEIDRFTRQRLAAFNRLIAASDCVDVQNRQAAPARPKYGCLDGAEHGGGARGMPICAGARVSALQVKANQRRRA